MSWRVSSGLDTPRPRTATPSCDASTLRAPDSTKERRWPRLPSTPALRTRRTSRACSGPLTASRRSATRDCPRASPFAMNSYDFVVVGAGTAGCVVAARLSEDPGAHVLLLEAGRRELPEAVAKPPAWPTLAGTSADWGGSSVVMAATGTSIALPRGRGLGGSSAINGMVFTRGHRSSYDGWVAAGAKGWGFDDLLPYLKRGEATTGRDPAVRGLR